MKGIEGLNKRSIICGIITLTCYCGGSVLAYIQGKRDGKHTGYKKGWHDGVHECVKIVEDYMTEDKES